jgi:hypothetical protein
MTANFGGSVRCATWEPLDAGSGRRVDDRPAAVVEQERDLVLHAEEHAAEVDVEYPVPVGFADVSGRCRA